MQQEQIFTLLFNKDEFSWQNIIYDLVKTEQMNPWDIDVSLIAQRFLDRIHTLHEMDLRLSGKIVLASSIFLKIKSNRLIDQDLIALDALIASAEEPPEDEFGYDDFYDLPMGGAINMDEKPNIYPRTPQPRKRKISVFDLVNALEKALEVQKRRKPVAAEHPDVRVPPKSRDMSIMIKEVHNKIAKFFKKATSKLTFSYLLPSETKEDKVMTFIPLLHLANMRKIDLFQKQHFGEIEIRQAKKSAAS